MENKSYDNAQYHIPYYLVKELYSNVLFGFAPLVVDMLKVPPIRVRFLSLSSKMEYFIKVLLCQNEWMKKWIMKWIKKTEKKDKNKKINKISNLLPTLAFKQEQQVCFHPGLRHWAVTDFHRATNAVTRVSVLETAHLNLFFTISKCYWGPTLTRIRTIPQPKYDQVLPKY